MGGLGEERDKKDEDVKGGKREKGGRVREVRD